MKGVLNLLKPPGMTSHDAVSVIRRLTGIRKIGHTGTLDPGAAGVLPLCIGQATRVAEYALVAFVVLDYITGVMLALLEKRLSSDIGARGIFKKVMIFCLVGVAHIIDSNIIGDGSVIRTAVIFFYLSNEGISIVENASKIGLPIPEKLKNVLAQLREGGESK
jgi:toxin secretion/phage lysis holin